MALCVGERRAAGQIDHRAWSETTPHGAGGVGGSGVLGVARRLELEAPARVSD